MKLWEMHCKFQQYDAMTAKNARPTAQPGQPSKFARLAINKATIPTPHRAGIASSELWRKKRCAANMPNPFRRANLWRGSRLYRRRPLDQDGFTFRLFSIELPRGF